MSNIPYYSLGGRGGFRFGHQQLLDGIIHDGLWDVYDNQHMGMCAEKCAADYGFSREDQDAYCLSSYERANAALAAGVFADEVVGVEVGGGRGKPGTLVTQDEEPGALKLDKLPGLRPAFKKDGTVTAANASSINDGAAAFVVMSAEKAAALGLKPVAAIRGFADAEQAPIDFTTAPSLAVPRALQHAGMTAGDAHLHEINEAFSVVAMANMQILGLDRENVNVFGGAVSMGHPIGMSGGRIIGTLMNALERKDKEVGVASICNGGGGASAIVIERLS